MNSFSFFLPGKLFICPSILNDRFAGWSNVGCRSLVFMILNISCQPLLACKVSFQKSPDSLMGTPYRELTTFLLLLLRFSLSLSFGFLIMMCHGVGLLASIMFGTFCASWTCMSVSFTKSGKFPFIIFFR